MEANETKAGDWFAVGCIISTFYFDNPGSGDPCAQKFGVSVGLQVLACVDVASHYGLLALPIPKTPDYFTAQEVMDFLRQVFKKHGLPRAGVVIAPSVWKSSAELLLDPEMESRGKLLEEFDVEIPPMPRTEMELIRKGIEAMGLKCSFESGE